jgi:hypothetical protein
VAVTIRRAAGGYFCGEHGLVIIGQPSAGLHSIGESRNKQLRTIFKSRDIRLSDPDANDSSLRRQDPAHREWITELCKYIPKRTADGFHAILIISKSISPL